MNTKYTVVITDNFYNIYIVKKYLFVIVCKASYHICTISVVRMCVCVCVHDVCVHDMCVHDVCVCMCVCLVEELTISLEDERELVKATKKKNTNLVKDLQRQLQNSNRYGYKYVCMLAQ